MGLKSAYGGTKYFKVYKDRDIGLDFSHFAGRTIIESFQDDDVASDQDVIDNGKQTCFRDLLQVKAALRQPYLRNQLNTWRTWQPIFGRLPRRY